MQWQMSVGLTIRGTRANGSLELAWGVSQVALARIVHATTTETEKRSLNKTTDDKRGQSYMIFVAQNYF